MPPPADGGALRSLRSPAPASAAGPAAGGPARAHAGVRVERARASSVTIARGVVGDGSAAGPASAAPPTPQAQRPLSAPASGAADAPAGAGGAHAGPAAREGGAAGKGGRAAPGEAAGAAAGARGGPAPGGLLAAAPPTPPGTTSAPQARPCSARPSFQYGPQCCVVLLHFIGGVSEDAGGNARPFTKQVGLWKGWLLGWEACRPAQVDR